MKYEDLVMDPEENIQDLCKFLNVAYEPNMLDFHETKARVSNLKWHKNIAKPLDSKRLDNWKREMAASDVILANFICKDLGQNFGYGAHQTELRFWMYPSLLIGIIMGWLYTRIEKMIFVIPLEIKAKLITLYRKWTGSLS